jgi:DNA-3-methyladenine glycosylase II
VQRGAATGAPQRRRDASVPTDGSIAPVERYRFSIAPDPPFRLDLTVWALRRRAHNAIDRWDGHTYRRALEFDKAVATIEVRQADGPQNPRLEVAIAESAIGRGTEPAARAALTLMLGLNIDVSPFVAMASEDPLFRGLVEGLRGLRPPRFPSMFEALINAIACQQLSLGVGIHLPNRLTEGWGRPLAGEPVGLRAFPAPRDLAAADPAALRRIGLSSTKARTIVEIASAVADGTLDLEALVALDDRATLAHLMSLRGIGRWSAEYVMLRDLGRLHVFPGDDVGARNKLERVLGASRRLDYDGVRGALACWQPYAGVPYFHLLLHSLSEAGLLTANAAG